jgi:hypothetical protein
LFVLAAFFGATTIAAFAGIKPALLLILIALLAARGAIVLRISSRRMLARAFTGALFHTLVSLSVVCHTVPPFCSMMRIGRTDWRPRLLLIKVHAKTKDHKFVGSRRAASIKRAFKRYTEHKSETAQGVRSGMTRRTKRTQTLEV